LERGEFEMRVKTTAGKISFVAVTERVVVCVCVWDLDNELIGVVGDALVSLHVEPVSVGG